MGFVCFDEHVDRCRLSSKVWIVASACAALALVACGESQNSLPKSSANSSSTQSTLPSHRRTLAQGATQLWILQGPGLEAQAMATDPVGITFFSNPSITVLYPVRANVAAPTTWNVILWQKYTSFATFQTAVTTGKVPVGTKVVGYDTEFWSSTPANEQSNPIGYTIQFAQLAHQYGFSVISMPAENLMQVLFPGQDKFAAFINYGMASAVAPYVDYYHIQSQDLEITPPSYASFNQTIISQVQSANPNVVITGGLSTAPTNAPQVTSAQLDAAMSASMGTVSGYWLNIVGATSATGSAALANYP